MTLEDANKIVSGPIYGARWLLQEPDEEQFRLDREYRRSMHYVEGHNSARTSPHVARIKRTTRKGLTMSVDAHEYYAAQDRRRKR